MMWSSRQAAGLAIVSLGNISCEESWLVCGVTLRLSVCYLLFSRIREGSCWKSAGYWLQPDCWLHPNVDNVVTSRETPPPHSLRMRQIERKEELAASWRYWDKYQIFLGKSSRSVRRRRQDVVDSVDWSRDKNVPVSGGLALTSVNSHTWSLSSSRPLLVNNEPEGDCQQRPLRGHPTGSREAC